METASQANRRELPLFPLSSVVMPGGLLPLRIFETRYVDMVRNCFKRETGFVVCAIKSGAEVGTAAQPYGIGCVVKIVDWDQDDRGLLTLMTLGTQKVQVVDSRVLDSQLVMGDVVDLPQDPTCPVPAEYQILQDAMAQILEQIAPSIVYDEPQLNDALWLGSRFIELLPLPLETRQQLMVADDPIDRLQQLLGWLRALSRPDRRD